MSACSSRSCTDPDPVATGFLQLPDFELEHGHVIEQCTVAWAQEGPDDGLPVVVLGGISANRFPAQDPDGNPGWWSEVVGDARAVDTRTYRVLSFDFLGSGESSRPSTPDAFAVSPADQARVARALLDALDITEAIVIGASYGGMVALAFAEAFPERCQRLAVLCAAHRTAPTAAGYRWVQRQIVRDALAAGNGARGVALARGLAMMGFRTAEELDDRFAGAVLVDDQVARLPIEKYLAAQGDRYAALTPPETFLCLSQSCDLAHVRPDAISVPLWLFGATSDRIVPEADIRYLAEGAPATVACTLVASKFGHDAFLKEVDAVTQTILSALAGGAA